MGLILPNDDLLAGAIAETIEDHFAGLMAAHRICGFDKTMAGARKSEPYLLVDGSFSLTELARAVAERLETGGYIS